MKIKKIKIQICWEHYVEYAYGVNKKEFESIIWRSIWDWVTIKQKWKAPWIYIATLEPHIIAHEAFHAVCHTADNVWINLSSDSEEWYAHSIDKIVNTIIKLHKKLWTLNK